MKGWEAINTHPGTALAVLMGQYPAYPRQGARSKAEQGPSHREFLRVLILVQGPEAEEEPHKALT